MELLQEKEITFNMFVKCIYKFAFSEYEARHSYIGATLGRVADRISGSKFTLDGKEVKVSNNDGPNQVHGGMNGFDMVRIKTIFDFYK